MGQNDRSRAAGIDLTFQVYVMAMSAYMKGEAERTLELMDIVFSRGTVSQANLDRSYKALGWDALPAFVERRSRHEAHVREERKAFLAVACGPDGFSSWQPSPGTCTQAEST